MTPLIRPIHPNVCQSSDLESRDPIFDEVESRGEVPIIYPGPRSTNCSVETLPVYDEERQVTYGVDVERCFEVLHRLPNLNLFQGFPELRERLEQLNRHQGSVQRSNLPPSTSSTTPTTPPPGAPSPHPVQPNPNPPQAPGPQTSPAPQTSRSTTTSTVASAITGAILGAFSGAGRALGASARAIWHLIP